MSETWTYVCTTAELLPGEMKVAFDEVTGTPIAVFNLDGMFYALEDQCTHEELLGVVAGGWQMGRAALAATRLMEDETRDRSFLSAKITTSRFYADHVLSQSGSLNYAIVHGASATLALEDWQF